MADYYEEAEVAEFYDLELEGVLDDVDFWKTLAHEYTPKGSAALELACGTLRVLLPLAHSGLRITGLDYSPHMLAKGKAKLLTEPAELQGRVDLVQGDMRTFELGRTYSFIFVPFNSLLHVSTVEDQLAFFQSVKKHLAPGGVLAFDVSAMHTVESSAEWTIEVDVSRGDLRYQRDRVRVVDPLRQKVRNLVRMKEYRNTQLTREWLKEFSWTYFLPRELEHLVARAGFEFIHFWSDFARTDFWSTPQPHRMVPVLRLRS